MHFIIKHKPAENYFIDIEKNKNSMSKHKISIIFYRLYFSHRYLMIHDFNSSITSYMAGRNLLVKVLARNINIKIVIIGKLRSYKF